MKCKNCKSQLLPNKHAKTIFCKQVCREKYHNDRRTKESRRIYSVKRWSLMTEGEKVVQRERQRRNALEIRLKVLSFYGSKCSCCGESNREFLALDHIKGGGIAHRKSLKKSGRSFYLWVIKNNFPNWLRILCHNCNLSLGFYGYCPHHADINAAKNIALKGTQKIRMGKNPALPSPSLKHKPLTISGEKQ